VNSLKTSMEWPGGRKLARTGQLSSSEKDLLQQGEVTMFYLCLS